MYCIAFLFPRSAMSALVYDSAAHHILLLEALHTGLKHVRTASPLLDDIFGLRQKS